MKINKQKTRGLSLQGSGVVRAKLSHSCTGGTLMDQRNRLEICWSLDGLAWPGGARFSILVASVHPNMKKIGKQMHERTSSQDSGCSMYRFKLYLAPIVFCGYCLSLNSSELLVTGD